MRDAQADEYYYESGGARGAAAAQSRRGCLRRAIADARFSVMSALMLTINTERRP